MKRGNVTNEQRAGRSLCHGKIDSLENAFRLTNNSPFTIRIIPVASIDEETNVVSAPATVGLMVNCILYEDDGAAPLMVPFIYPSEALFFEISSGAIDLSTYNVYWECGLEDSAPVL